MYRELRGVPPVQRMRECLDIGYSRWHKKMSSVESAAPDRHGLYPCNMVIDLSQDAARKAHAASIRSMCANSTFYAYGPDRLLLPQEHLAVLGWPPHTTDGLNMSSSSIRDLAGESMCPAAIAVVLTAVCFGLMADVQ